jgi:hypothetical protein
MTTRFLTDLAACTRLHVGRARRATASSTLDRVLSFPFADNVVASAAGPSIAWTCSGTCNGRRKQISFPRNA